MSNFIYNDNFNGDNGDKEPIQFNFNSKPARKQSLAVTILLSILLSFLAFAFVYFMLYGLPTAQQSNVPNTVYTNSIYKSTETSYTSTQSGSRADIIAGIKDSVVEIRTQYVVSQQHYIKSGAGSGVIAGSFEASNGKKGYYIITNAHVIEAAASSQKSSIQVTLTDGTKYDASVVGSDTRSDIAVLKIEETKSLKCAIFANEDFNLRVGDEVIAIGNPLGQLGGTVTNGYISALDREIEIDGIRMNLLQTDAPINPGNSGGGLFNIRGELIGIVNAKSTGSDIEGIGFAIPSGDALKVYEDIINYGYVTGTPTIYVAFDMQYNGGVYVTEIIRRGTGDNSSKLQVNDLIYGAVVDGKNVEITSKAQLDSIIANSKIGSELTLYVRRGYQQGTVTVKIYEFTY